MSTIHSNGPSPLPKLPTLSGAVAPPATPLPAQVSGFQDVYVPANPEEPLLSRATMQQFIRAGEPDLSNLVDHMTRPGKVSGGQINYAHPEAEFHKILKERFGTTVTRPTGLPGVNIQEYNLPKLERGKPVIGADGQPVPGKSAPPKTTFGPEWTPQRITDLFETVFGDLKPSGTPGQVSTTQVQIGNDIFVAKFKADGTPDKFYLTDTPVEGTLHTKKPSVLEPFRQPAPKAAASEAPKAATEGPKAATEPPKAAAEGPKAATEGPKAAAEGPKAATEPPKAASEAPKAATEAPKAPTGEAPKASAAPAEGALSKVARVGGGVLSLGFGGVQAYQGVQSLREGKALDGVTDTAGGALNVVGGVGLLAGSTVVAPLALAGAAGLDAGRTIIQGVQTGDREKVAVGGVKALGATMMGAAPFVTGSVIGAPVGVVLGIAGGALYAGAAVYESREAVGKAVVRGAEAVADTAVRAGTAVTDTAAKVGGAVVEGVTGVGKWASSLW